MANATNGNPFGFFALNLKVVSECSMRFRKIYGKFQQPVRIVFFLHQPVAKFQGGVVVIFMLAQKTKQSQGRDCP